MYARGKQVFSSKRISCFPLLTYYKISFINISSRRGEDKFFYPKEIWPVFLNLFKHEFYGRTFKMYFIPHSKYPKISVTKTTVLIEHSEIISVSCKRIK